MSWLIRVLRVPANESHMSFVLAASALSMGIMSLVIVWQAQIIASQRDLIAWLQKIKLGI